MKLLFWYVLFLALLTAVQATFVDSWKIRGVSPDLLLIVAISFGVNLGIPEGAVAGFIVGFIEGAVHSTHLGSYLVSRCAGGASAGLLQQVLSRDNPVSLPVCAFVASFASEFVFFLMAPQFPLKKWMIATLTFSCLNAIIAPLMHWLLTSLLHRLERRQTMYDRISF